MQHRNWLSLREIDYRIGGTISLTVYCQQFLAQVANVLEISKLVEFKRRSHADAGIMAEIRS